jgi:hypothetical protein
MLDYNNIDSEPDRVRANTAGDQPVDRQKDRGKRSLLLGPTQRKTSERLLEAMASSLSLIMLGATVDRRWFLLPTAVLPFLLLHAVQGWCPQVPLLRRLGVRTRGEIDRERYALKALAGDFAGAASVCSMLSKFPSTAYRSMRQRSVVP